MRISLIILAGLFSLSALAQNAESLANKKKRIHSASITFDNALGGTGGISYLYNLPHNPWMIGAKYRYIDNITSDIKISGHTLSIEVQRYLWHRKRLQFWATSEAGIMKVNLDFSKLNALQEDISESALIFSGGLEGRYNLTARLRLIFGGGIIFNNLANSYEGYNQEYQIEVNSMNVSGKLGLLYFF